jgi:hypothetical protein
MANFFTEVAKFLVTATLKAKFKKMDETPDAIKLREEYIQSRNNLNKTLPDFCKRNPDSPLCRDYFKEFPNEKPKPYVLEDVVDFINEKVTSLTKDDIKTFLKTMEYASNISRNNYSAEGLQAQYDTMQKLIIEYTSDISHQIIESEKEYKVSIGMIAS